MNLLILIVLVTFIVGVGCGAIDPGQPPRSTTQPGAQPSTITPIAKTEAEWRATLTPAQYDVLRHQGTERAFTGVYCDNHEAGKYVCAGCGLELFASDTKFESGTGWPSFYAPVAQDRVKINRDTTHGMVREEVVCPRCGGHLGHVFNDGPKPTGLRYCMNSAALKFEKK
jgi:peptide-methionine (R)-S-oxide reductase